MPSEMPEPDSRYSPPGAPTVFRCSRTPMAGPTRGFAESRAQLLSNERASEPRLASSICTRRGPGRRPTRSLTEKSSLGSRKSDFGIGLSLMSYHRGRVARPSRAATSSHCHGGRLQAPTPGTNTGANPGLTDKRSSGPTETEYVSVPCDTYLNRRVQDTVLGGAFTWP